VQTKKNKTLAIGKKAKKLAVLFSPLLLIGCEASLNIEKINQELDKQVRRTDQFQSLATNNQQLVAVGADGADALVLTSSLKNIKWTRKIIARKSTLIEVVTCPDQSFVALATDKNVWRSSDHGINWQSTELPTQEDILALTCGPDNGIWVVGSFSTIMHSKDQGKTWNSNTLNEDAMLTHIRFIDDKTALVVGEFGVFSRSNDGGISWNLPEYIPNDFYVQNAHFNSIDEGWVAGLSGQILYTKDGGKKWKQQVTPTESPIYGFYKTVDSIFAFGDHSTLLELDGDEWKRSQSQSKPVYLRDALLINDKQLLLAGGSGSLYQQEIETTKKLTSNSHKSEGLIE